VNHRRPSVLDQFVEYLRDHLLLDRSVDVNRFYHGKSLPGCLEAREPGDANDGRASILSVQIPSWQGRAEKTVLAGVPFHFFTFER
jgi:hypothetical protein